VAVIYAGRFSISFVEVVGEERQDIPVKKSHCLSVCEFAILGDILPFELRNFKNFALVRHI
jgi:hypothetical protein